MTEIEKLHVFIIQRFILVLVLVGIAEMCITQLVNRLMLPFMQWYFFGNQEWQTITHEPKIPLLMGILLIELLLVGVYHMLPTTMQPGIVQTIRQIEKMGGSNVESIMGDASVVNMDGDKGLLLFFFVIAIIALLLIPYILGALWYAWSTTKQVKKIQKKQDAIRQEYDRKRNRLLSDIAHDLRTPITTVSGYAKALADGMVTKKDKQQEYLQSIQNKSARMEELIQLLFEYVKLGSDGFQLTKEEVNLSELLRKNVALLYSDVEDAGMDLVVEIPEVAHCIEADEIQLSRVITNLVTNAIRHNDAGTTIFLSLEREIGAFSIVIADTGKPIPQEVAKHLFEPFVMGDDSRSTKGGSGLGLSIAHKIVEMHGGELTFTTDYKGYTKAFLLKIT